ncbi:hypothetical protein BT96DRAFT_951358 [Gymnopus androsaceus JB14]|uniref:Uncharacterized protein n=1 Tax=Gymnopus androsaceus JB14 TaxID=1447944 RepID=A0A6A4GDH8_9AGAR|nr:hypothetical protein BT96DRAFT_951358 [Gymnopus androsaceus JB14]
MGRIIPPVSMAPAEHFDVAKLIRNFIAANSKTWQTFHLVHVLAWNRHPIHPAHLLDDNNLTPALLTSLLVDFGFYKAALVYNASSELEPGYIPYTALLKNLKKLPINFNVELIIDRVSRYLQQFSTRAASLKFEETLQFSLKWLFPEFDITMEVAVFNKGEGFGGLFIITNETYFIAELKNLALDLFNNVTAEQLKNSPSPEKILHSSFFPPGKKGRTKHRKSYRVGELLEVAKVQATGYARAVQQGKPKWPGGLGVPIVGSDNAEWITIADKKHPHEIPICTFVILLLGGSRILSAECERISTRVCYQPGPKLKGWRSFLETLNYRL